MDRCALFVDAGYVLADGAMAVHGTRNRDSVSWDYAGVISFLGTLARERTGLPLLRCYWYEATVESRRTPEHDALADLPGVKLRLGRMRPGRREGVESEIHRDLATLARNSAVSDALVVSAEEDLAQVIADVQDLGVRVTIVHITVDGNWTISRTLRQECDDIIELGDAHLRPYVDLVVGAEPAGDEREPVGAYAGRASGNGHAAVTALTHQTALPAGGHPAPPAIYTSPVIAEYQRSAHPQANGQPGPLASAGAPGGARPALHGAMPAQQPSPAPDPRAGLQDVTGVPGQDQGQAPLGQGHQPGQGRAPAGQGPAQHDQGRGTGAEPAPAQAPQPAAGMPQAMPGQPVPGQRGLEHPQSPQSHQGPHGLAGGQGPGGQHAAPGQAGSGPIGPPGHAGPGPMQQGHTGLGQPGLGQSGPMGQLGQPDPGQAGRPAHSPSLPEPPRPGQPAMPAGPGMEPPGMSPGQPAYPPGPYRGPGQEVPGAPPAGGRPMPGGPPAPAPAGQAPPPIPGNHAESRPYPPGPPPRYPGGPPDAGYPGMPGQQDARMAGPGYVPQQGPYSGPQPAAQHAPVPQPAPVSLADAVQAAHGEGFTFGQAVAREAPALWLEAVLARKPRMPSDLEARLLQDSSLPIDSLLHDEVRHALRRGFWDALERSRH